MANIVKPEVIQALAWYRLNTGTRRIVEDIYGDGHHGNYLDEKENTLTERGLLYHYCFLDTPHRRKLIKAIEERYSEYFSEVGVA